MKDAPEQFKPQHVVLNLDRELCAAALTESLELLQQLRESPQDYSRICPQLSLRVSYVLLHGDLPEFKRFEVQRMARFHAELATSLLVSQRRLWEMHHSSASRPA